MKPMATKVDPTKQDDIPMIYDIMAAVVVVLTLTAGGFANIVVPYP